MSETIMNYPGFQSLPKGVKQMLLFSEAHFFDEAVAPASAFDRATRAETPAMRFGVLLKRFTNCAARSALSLRRFHAGVICSSTETGEFAYGAPIDTRPL